MFGALYAKALDLFGRAFLLSSFLPCLIVVVGVHISIDRHGFLALLETWAEKELNAKASWAILLLLGVYLLAYVLYGIRDAVTGLLRTGRFWILPSARAWRRRRFLRALLARQESYDVSLGIPQAAVWAAAGFPAPDLVSVVVQRDVSVDQLLERARLRLDRLEEAKVRKRLGRSLGVADGDDLAQLLWALHQLAVLSPAVLEPLLGRLRALATHGNGVSLLPEWCRTIQQRSYGELVDAFQPVHAEPAEKDIQPTALGNVLACGAAYSRRRYGIQAPLLHPRLAKVVDKDYQAKLDDAKTFFDFAILTTLLCALAGLFVTVWFSWPEDASSFPWPPQPLSPRRAVVVLAWFAASHLFYRVAVASARTYAMALNSAIDLYRLKLLDALAVAPPSSVREEQEIWRQLDASFLEGTLPDVRLTSAKEPAPGME